MVADIASLGDTIRPALFQKVTEERMRFAAHHDDLTQLSNRLMFQERLRKAIAAARSVDQAIRRALPGPGRLQTDQRHPRA